MKITRKICSSILILILLFFSCILKFNAQYEDERQEIYNWKEFFSDLLDDPDNVEDLNENGCNSGSNSYFYPIGSDETITSNGKTLAIGEPTQNDITSPFGDTDGRSSPHSGVDLGPYSAEGVANVIAAQSGTVEYANTGCISGGDMNCGGGFGNYIIIKHDDGNYTLYAHLHQNSVKVNNGDSVIQGQVIAKVGNSGHSFGRHLHFEVREGSNDSSAVVDPMNYISKENPRGTIESSNSNSTGQSTSTEASKKAFSGDKSSENNAKETNKDDKNTSTTTDNCELPAEFIEFESIMEGGQMDGDYYVAQDIQDGAGWTIHGITAYEGQSIWDSVGIDYKTISVGTKVHKDKMDEVFKNSLLKHRKSVESLLAENGITMNNNQILSLVDGDFNGGSQFTLNVIEGYKQYGDTYKVFQSFCEYVHNNGNVLPGLVKRRKLGWLIYTDGIYIPSYDSQSDDGCVECIGNFNVPNDHNGKVSNMLKETATGFNGKINYY